MDVLTNLTVRLGALGYLIGEADKPLLAYSLSKSEQYIENDCNISEIPEALKYALIDLAAADYLLARKAAPTADEDGTDGGMAFERAVKSIQEGDTTVTYLTGNEGGATPEMRLDILISQLRADAVEQLLPFRRLKW